MIKFWLVTGASLAPVGGLVFSSLMQSNKSSGEENPIESMVGKPAPDFSLTDYTGKAISLHEMKGKKVVLFFNEGIMCYPACWNQIAALGTDSKLNNENAATFSIVTDNKQSWDEAIQRMPDLGKESILLDTDSSVSSKYGVLNLPSSMHPGMKAGHTYLVIDKDGIVRYTYDDPTMSIQNDKLEQELSKI